MVDFTNHKEGTAFFNSIGRDITSALMVRHGRRMLLWLAPGANPRASPEWLLNAVIMPTLRCVGIALVVDEYPTGALHPAARAAADAAHVAASAAAASFADAASVAAHGAADANARYAAADAAYAAFLSDVTAISQNSVKAAALRRMPLWREGMPPEVAANCQDLKDFLKNQNQDWQVWFELFETHLDPNHFNKPLGEQIALKDEAFWNQDSAAINAGLRRLVVENAPRLVEEFAPRPQIDLNRIMEVASPTVVINASGQLDSEANSAIDILNPSRRVNDLILIQIDNIDVLLRCTQFSRDAEKMLENYREEIKKHPARQMSSGRLQNCLNLFNLEVLDSPSALEPLSQVAKGAADSFAFHHQNLIELFTKLRDQLEVYAATQVHLDESKYQAVAHAARQFELAAQSSLAEGTVTEQFVEDAKAFRVTVNAENSSNANIHINIANQTALPPTAEPHQQIAPEPRKNFFFRFVGWISKTWALGTSVWTAAGSPLGIALIVKAKILCEALKEYFSGSTWT